MLMRVASLYKIAHRTKFKESQSVDCIGPVPSQLPPPCLRLMPPNAILKAMITGTGATMLIRHLILAVFAYAVAVHSCQAQTQTGGAAKEIIQRQVAPDLYFLYDQTSSNSAFLVTDDGVLVVDSRHHPRDGQDLLNRIRSITDKPIKWVVNTHFHGDHTYGNSVFKAAGATIIAHKDTARIMQQVADKEFERRQPFFRSRSYDPREVQLTRRT
jgi:metallo-beta-lactamase superfamily protein